MKLGILSDIHANWDALDAVLRDADAAGVGEFFCLGDAIGYGAEPNRVIETLQQRGIASVLGNHELAVLDPDYLAWFNPVARTSIEMTAQWLTESSRRYIAGMHSVQVLHGCRFVHGFPPDSVTTYRFEVPPEERLRIIQSLDTHICFIGHTHDLNLVTVADDRIDSTPLEQGTITLLPSSSRYLINSGSVGQPRDGDNRAKYAILDTSEFNLDVRFVSYDIAAAAAKIRSAGLPKVHADRLW